MLNKDKKIYVAGHLGMVGSAILRALKEDAYDNIIVKTRRELDLTNQQAVNHFFESEKPEQVYLAAARVGGIYANDHYPAEFIYENLVIQSNIVHAAYQAGVDRLLFLGSSCIYPKVCEQPMDEHSLLTGYLEPTNEPYAIAKIAGIKLCESYNRQYHVDYRSVMPTNLYGPGDNYHPENSHVIPGLIQRFHEAKVKQAESVTVWGSGNPRREFLFVDDLAKACLFVMNLDIERYQSVTSPMESHLNVGFGEDITIKQLVHLIQEVVGFQGQIVWDTSKADGPLRKLIDSRKINALGWMPSTVFKEGLQKTYQHYLESIS
jgi:GDP-L-fucose synthase